MLKLKRGIILIFLTASLSLAQDKIDFNVELLDGESKNFSEMYSEGPTLINFWALWCKPCRTEMKALNDIYKKYSDRGFQILGINQDTPRSVAKVKSFVASLSVEYHIGLDPNQELFNMFNGQLIPLTILYDNEGNVVYQNTGYLPGDEFKIEEAVKKVLGDE